MKFLRFPVGALPPAILFFFGLAIVAAAAPPPQPDWEAVSKILNRRGTLVGDVYKLTFPRTDLRVQLDGEELRPPLALTYWMAFQPVGDQVVVLGDLVLKQDEVNPVISALQQGGIDVTALHNHLLNEKPRLTFLHFWGRGDAVALATTLQKALSQSDAVSTIAPPAWDTSSGNFPTEEVERILGQKGKMYAGVFQVSVPRASNPHVGGIEAVPAMGMATALNFQPLGAQAFAAGDFVLLPAEVNPVVRALRAHGLLITAIHNHMLGEEPPMTFLHFWGRGAPQELARGLRAALDQMQTVPMSHGEGK